MKQISIGLRIGTMLLDHFLICFTGIPLLMLISFLINPNGLSGQVSSFAMLPLFTIYFCKDSVGGRSAAKRILGLVVIDKDAKTIASPLQCVVRNLFDIVWPIEVIISLFNQRQRIGDRVAGTEIAFYDPSTFTETSLSKIFIAILIGAGSAFFLMSLCNWLLLT